MPAVPTFGSLLPPQYSVRNTDSIPHTRRSKASRNFSTSSLSTGFLSITKRSVTVFSYAFSRMHFLYYGHQPTNRRLLLPISFKLLPLSFLKCQLSKITHSFLGALFLFLLFFQIEISLPTDLEIFRFHVSSPPFVCVGFCVG